MRELQPGWEKLRDKTKAGQLWANPGPYLHESLLKNLAMSIGDVELPKEFMAGNTFSGPNIPKDQEETSTADLVSAFIDEEDFDNDDNEEDDDDDE
ncbi:hypothetical protein N431DRAFT_102520 [Stipitochalara longipes BDJ]|nr:hypothetical protein N431DRAFT_102520 [Stipitochalara longipes BDJ]